MIFNLVSYLCLEFVRACCVRAAVKHTQDGNTALDIAMDQGHSQVVALLEK